MPGLHSPLTSQAFTCSFSSRSWQIPSLFNRLLLLEEACCSTADGLLSLSSLTLQTYTFSSHSLSLLGNRRREREKENDCEGECVCKERRCELTSLDCPLTGHKRKALKANRLTVNSQDLWLAKDNRFLNPKISYERILMAPPCRLISLFLIL